VLPRRPRCAASARDREPHRRSRSEPRQGGWGLRELMLSPTTGLFRQAAIKLTLDSSLMGSATLASFINQSVGPRARGRPLRFPSGTSARVASN